MTLDDLVKRADELVTLASSALARMQDRGYGPSVRSDDFGALRAASLSFIEMTYGREHSYYREFDRTVTDTSDHYTKRALGILRSIKEELAGGWLRTTRGLVSAEVFADFLGMAEHLLTEGYKDAAAVMIGSVLEEHLRQMAIKYGVPLQEDKNGRRVRRKTDVINADLCKAGAYGKLDQQNVTSWLALRNKAAHGQYTEYEAKQVELFMASVRDFVVRHPL